MSELGGEKIDIIEWSPIPTEFIEDSLSPAQVMEVKIVAEPNTEKGERGHAIAEVAPDQQSLAIGRGGQNVRLAAKLTGWKIDIVSAQTGDALIVSAQTGDALAEADADGTVEIDAPDDSPIGAEIDALEDETGTTTISTESNEDEPTKDRDINPDSEEEDEIDTPEEAEKIIGNEIEIAEEIIEEELKKETE